ncbi:MAG TPA: class I SAM-dependent methyltransferase [Solirubrobacterales bacterium]
MTGAVPSARANPARASRAELRRAMFLSQDSVVLCMTLRALDEIGVLEPSLEGKRPLSELYPEMTAAGFGAIRVAMHSLCGAGWLEGAPSLDPGLATFEWTEAGRRAMELREPFVAIGDLLASFAEDRGRAWREPWSESQAEAFRKLATTAVDRWSVPADWPEDEATLVGELLDLALVVSPMLWLHESGRLGERAPELPADPFGEGAAGLLGILGWLDDEGWTPSGEQARTFALNFGGVITYLPLFARLPEIYRGELNVTHDPGEPEWHVLRDLNLRISGAAHKRYFSESEPIFLELFDREPIERQPAFIADMGCGNGSWLVHLFEVIRSKTVRGRHLDEHPLTMVGVDPDPGARATTERKLAEAGALSLVISGDVTDPDRLAADLATHGLRVEDGLHIRAFIDHERTYRGDAEEPRAPGWASSVYMDAGGRAVSGEDIERDLIAHLRRWKPHVHRHGLVVLEAHSVAPSVMKRHLGALHGIAFDAHQAYSKQYTVDHASFLRCSQAAGLQPAGYCERRYPTGRPFVSISLNRLLVADGEPLPGIDPAAARHDTWRPDLDADLEDGRALHEIIFNDGDLRHPALWCNPPTGFVVARALEAIEKRLEECRPGETIRVMDYGAGTGTAAIELLKACKERDIERRLERADVGLELHLVDIPSSWYAQGYELLGACTWARFHSLRSEDGGFRPLSEVLGGSTMDAAMANMVFHLIPPKAMERTAAGLASVLVPGGTLAWSAPDLGPPGPEAVLLHDPNRALRERWLELLRDADPAGLPPAPAEAVRQARAELDEQALAAAQRRAERRIRPRPLVDEVVAALSPHFDGETVATAYEMLGEEIVRGMLVPSNQAEYMPEIADRALREAVIRELMLKDVLPSLQAGPAGTALGLNYHWVLGRFSQRA